MVRNCIPQDPTYVAFANSCMFKIMDMKMVCMSPLVKRIEKYLATGCAQNHQGAVDCRQAGAVLAVSKDDRRKLLRKELIVAKPDRDN